MHERLETNEPHGHGWVYGLAVLVVILGIGAVVKERHDEIVRTRPKQASVRMAAPESVELVQTCYRWSDGHEQCFVNGQPQRGN